VLLTRNNGKAFPDDSGPTLQVLGTKGIISRAETQGRWAFQHGVLLVFLCASASLRELVRLRPKARLGHLRMRTSWTSRRGNREPRESCPAQAPRKSRRPAFRPCGFGRTKSQIHLSRPGPLPPLASQTQFCHPCGEGPHTRYFACGNPGRGPADIRTANVRRSGAQFPSVACLDFCLRRNDRVVSDASALASIRPGLFQGLTPESPVIFVDEGRKTSLGRNSTVVIHRGLLTT